MLDLLLITSTYTAVLSPIKDKAVPSPSTEVYPPIYYLLEKHYLEKHYIVPIEKQTISSLSEESEHTKSDVVLQAQLENFNPQLHQEFPDSREKFRPEIHNVPSTLESEISDTQNDEFTQFKLESIILDYDLNSDNFGQRNQFTEARLSVRTDHDDLVHWRFGFNTFDQRNVERIDNVPLEFGWSREIDTIKLEIHGSVDYFDRLDIVPGFRVNVEYPIFARVNDRGELQSLLVIGGEIDRKPYKFNATTLENEVRYWRVRPNIFWQFTPDTSLFSFGQVGDFTDGNQEFQSFTRLEHQFDQLEGKIGTFFVAANLFTWAFRQDLEAASGYFSPPDFLVYSAEAGWSGKISDILQCRISASQGQQRLLGSFDNASNLQSSCNFTLSSHMKLNIDYGISNVINSSGDTAFETQSISGNLRINF